MFKEEEIEGMGEEEKLEKAILMLREEGLTQRSIGEVVGVSQGKVHNVLRKHGLTKEYNREESLQKKRINWILRGGMRDERVRMTSEGEGEGE